jgi:hypothetical protein
MTTDKHDQPEAAPSVVGREEFDAALAEQVAPGEGGHQAR